MQVSLNSRLITRQYSVSDRNLFYIQIPCEQQGTKKETLITVETLAGIKTLVMTAKNGKIETARVDMGEPILEPEKIPVISNENPVKSLKLEAEDNDFTFTCVSMGNPHAVTFIKEDVNKFDICKYGTLKKSIE